MASEIDELFKLPLGEFTSARNALAAKLKKAGRAAEADEVKALPKPSASVWAVNQLYWRFRPDFDRLLDAGERLRAAQSAQLARGAADVRESVNARRDAVAALLRAAERVLHDGGHGASRDTLRRVTTTLEALSVYGSLPDAPRAGRLTADVETPGFETVAALLPGGGAAKRAATRPPPAPSPPKATRGVESAEAAARRREQERKQSVAAAKLAVREAERALNAARKRAERAANAFETAEARASEQDAKRAELERQLARAANEAAAARSRAREAESGAKDASQAAEGAERALEAARRALAELEGDG
ncbi:MAG TPA: hypothetical protein VFX89_15175 [Gammaproteobacteria bacterium]|nr:hypothetical protein [Gammaproteobacteria bacterium]